MKKKLQIYRSAEQAAEDSLSCSTKLEVQQFALKRFDEEHLHPNDFEFWIQIFDQQRQNFAQLNTLKSSSALPAQP